MKLPAKDPRDVGPSGKTSQRSVGLAAWQWERIEEICEAEGYTQAEFFREVIRSFVDEHDAKSSASKKTSSTK